jgi:hypothetical protein
VLGSDLSPTAIAKARATFPDNRRAGCAGVYRAVAEAARRCRAHDAVPPNPIGMVKSPGELIEAFTELFDIEHKLVLDDQIVIVLGSVRNKA